MEGREELVGAQHSLLDHIFGVGTIAQQPTGKVGGAVQVRQHKLLEPDFVALLQQVADFSTLRCNNRRSSHFIPEPASCQKTNLGWNKTSLLAV
jgi:hypothetical protein